MAGPSQQDIQRIMALGKAGKLAEVETQARQLLEMHPDAAILHSILGSALAGQGRFEDAVASNRQALEIEPHRAYMHSNLGNVLTRLGRFEEAVASLQQAVRLDPSNALAHGNLGNALVYQGRFDEALLAYQQALSLNPNIAQMHNNLANTLVALGRVDEALAAFRRALNLRADAGTFFNMHSLLIDVNDMEPAIQCMKAALNLQPGNIGFKLFMGMLLEYSGKAKHAAAYFEEVRNGSNLDKARLDAWNYIKTASKNMPRMIGSRIEAFRLGMGVAPPSGLVLEFGVRHGVSIRQIAALAAQEVHGFDSFEGLPEAWNNGPKGSFTTNGVIPEVPSNVRLYPGWFEKTLPEFVTTHKEPVRFMNIDCDIYSATKTILDCLATQIVPGTVIVFDEYIGNESWREDEFKAFQEAVNTYGWKYEYLAFSMFTKQVAVRML